MKFIFKMILILLAMVARKWAVSSFSDCCLDSYMIKTAVIEVSGLLLLFLCASEIFNRQLTNTDRYIYTIFSIFGAAYLIQVSWRFWIMIYLLTQIQ